MPKLDGIIVNSFESLEPRTIETICDGLCVPDGPTPPIYCVGRLIAGIDRRSGVSAGDGVAAECLTWLDKQPKNLSMAIKEQAELDLNSSLPKGRVRDALRLELGIGICVSRCSNGGVAPLCGTKVQSSVASGGNQDSFANGGVRNEVATPQNSDMLAVMWNHVCNGRYMHYNVATVQKLRCNTVAMPLFLIFID
ncbi:hypothetical protein REPUB_Repub07fG0143000 [Reevesia pubescens]